MNTGKLHARFWAAMSDRYGVRWRESYGETVSPTWRDLVDKFTPNDLKLALEGLAKVSPDHPPTLPQFEKLLRDVSMKSRAETEDFIRGYWRALIIAEVSFHLGHTVLTLEPVLLAHRDLGRAMRDLLDELDNAEKRQNQRTQGLQDLCCRRSTEIAKAFPQCHR